MNNQQKPAKAVKNDPAEAGSGKIHDKHDEKKKGKRHDKHASKQNSKE